MTENSPTAPAKQTDSAPREAYEKRLREINDKVQEYTRRDLMFVRIRTGIFVAALLLGILCIGEARHVSWLWMLLPAGIFAALVPFHQRCLKKLSTAQAIVRFHESRLNRLDRKFGSDVVDGAEFADELHPWTQDLDVFGRGSLFQMLNECRTLPGRRHLAGWMTQICTGEAIRVRQARAQGLKNELNLREALACVPDSANWQTAEVMLRQWVQEPSQPISIWILIWSSLIGVIAVPVIALAMLEMIQLRFVLLLIVRQTPAVIMTRRQIRQTASQMDNVDSALRQFGQVIEVFEKHHVDEPAVRDLQNRFHSESETASHAIHRLSNLTQWQNNAIFANRTKHLPKVHRVTSR